MEAYFGSQATEALAKAEMPRFHILHFATHSVLDETNPLYSYGTFSRSGTGSGKVGLLGAREIMKTAHLHYGPRPHSKFS